VLAALLITRNSSSQDADEIVTVLSLSQPHFTLRGKLGVPIFCLEPFEPRILAWRTPGVAIINQ